MGEEICPRTQRPHIQGYVEFFNGKTLSAAKTALGDPECHLEMRMGTALEAANYCKKDGKWKEWGKISRQGKRTDLDDAYEMIKDGLDMFEVMEEHTGTFIRYYRGLFKCKDQWDIRNWQKSEKKAPQIIVLIGASGTGKTHNAKKLCGERYFQYMCQQQGKCYFDGYEREPVIWLDEFSGSATMDFDLFLRLGDKNGVRVETKGSSVQIFGVARIVISTTIPPGEWWENDRKFRKDPMQLWRRITKIYYVPGKWTDDYFYKPMLVPRDRWELTNQEAYLSSLEDCKIIDKAKAEVMPEEDNTYDF